MHKNFNNVEANQKYIFKNNNNYKNGKLKIFQMLINTIYYN